MSQSQSVAMQTKILIRSTLPTTARRYKVLRFVVYGYSLYLFNRLGVLFIVYF